MRVCLLQINTQWEQPEENERRAMELIRQHAACDLYVLPEMWATGFNSPTPDSEACLRLARLSRLAKAPVMGGASIAADDFCAPPRNTLILQRTDGSRQFYDKRHLFAPAGEDELFQPGHNRQLWHVKDAVLLPIICYDLRFPVWCRTRHGGDYDVLVCSANWPEPRMDVWRTLLKARAIENLCYVVGVNRVGSDPKCLYVGGSMVIDPYGRIIAEAGNLEQAISCELDLTLLSRFRSQFPVLQDADPFQL